MKLIKNIDNLYISSTLLKKDLPKSAIVPNKWNILKNKILGSEHELSIVFIGKRLSKKLNYRYRKMTYEPDVLSFPLSKTHGEIFINPYIAEKKCKQFGMTSAKYISFLVIHGILHLNGFKHGAKMEAAERNILRNF